MIWKKLIWPVAALGIVGALHNQTGFATDFISLKSKKRSQYVAFKDSRSDTILKMSGGHFVFSRDHSSLFKSKRLVSFYDKTQFISTKNSKMVFPAPIWTIERDDFFRQDSFNYSQNSAYGLSQGEGKRGLFGGTAVTYRLFGYSQDNVFKDWEFKWSEPKQLHALTNPILTENNVYLVLDRQGLIALDRFTGKALWKGILTNYQVISLGKKLFTVCHPDQSSIFCTIDEDKTVTVLPALPTPGSYFMAADGKIVIKGEEKDGNSYLYFIEKSRPNKVDFKVPHNCLYPRMLNLEDRVFINCFENNDAEFYVYDIAEEKFRPHPISIKRYFSYVHHVTSTASGMILISGQWNTQTDGGDTRRAVALFDSNLNFIRAIETKTLSSFETSPESRRFQLDKFLPVIGSDEMSIEMIDLDQLAKSE